MANGLTVSEWIAILAIVIVNGGALVTFFMNQNVKIAELYAKYLSLSKELSEHKDDNKDSFNEIKKIVSETQQNNREDHGKLFDKLDKVGEQVINATRTFLNNPNI